MEDGTGTTVRSSLGSARAIPLRRDFLGCLPCARQRASSCSQPDWSPVRNVVCDAWSQETLCGLGVVT